MVNQLSSPKKFQGGDTARARQNTRKLGDIAKKNKGGLGKDPILLNSYGPPSKNYKNAALRYPKADIQENSDYVLFEFKKYKPPFAKQNRITKQDDGTFKKDQHGQYDYNRSGEYEDADPAYRSIIMYMPEDVSTGFRGKWGGKAFSTFGANTLRSAGAEGFDKIGGMLKTGGQQFKKGIQLAGAQAIQQAISSVTGDSLSNDDVFGSISGAILNPNTELLFQAIDMRNFQLQFQLVPRNDKESEIINEITQIFKMCTLPSRDPGKVFGGKNDAIDEAFIGVPNLCRVSFMRGAEEHDVLPRYKMCAVTSMDVNYTPDGSYATYPDGQPVAMQLKLNFQETKIVFADEVQGGSIR